MDIFASKLFKSSSRQDKIRAAANDPINVELVKQISNYIDPEYQDELKQAKMEEDMKDPESVKDEESENSDFDAGFESSPSSSGSSFPSTPSGANGKFDMPDDFGSESDMDFDESSESDAPEPPEDEVSEATDINPDIEENPVKIISDNISTIKDILSSKDDIARIQVKENSKELWIYYNDKINLNSIMENVISELSDSEYNNLSFNRLARTENAIVFSIDDYLE